MLVQSLVNVIEAASASLGKRYSGNIQNIDELMSNENLIKLERAHDGIFAFLAFHPVADKLIADYIRLGSIGGDAGKNVFALFTFDSLAHKPTSMDTNAFQSWLSIDEGDYPAYIVVRDLFPNSTPPRLPGILFIEKFSEPTESIFVSLEGHKTLEDVVVLMRKLFETATSTYLSSQENDNDLFVSRFSIELAKSHVTYKRSGKSSMREWLIKAFYKVRAHAGDIVSVVKLFK